MIYKCVLQHVHRTARNVKYMAPANATSAMTAMDSTVPTLPVSVRHRSTSLFTLDCLISTLVCLCFCLSISFMGALKMQEPKMQDLKMRDQMSGPENAGSENAGPYRIATSLCCVCMAKLTVTSSKGIGVILSWFFNEYAAIRDIFAYRRFTCIPLQCLNKTLACLLC